MKLILFLIQFLFIFNGIAKAQINEKVQLHVKYKFIHVQDTTQRDRPYTEEFLLKVGKTSSAYLSLDEKRMVELRDNELRDQIGKSADKNSLNLTLTGTRQVNYSQYFQYLPKRQLYIMQKLNNDYLTNEPLPIINWKISSQTKRIGKFMCQKASGYFKGRNYIAWFCADLPVQSGPWKLNGLPGLILQASDSRNEVIFEFIGFESTTSKNLLIQLPSHAIRVSKKDIDRLLELQRKDPGAYAKLPSGKIAGILGDLDPSRVNSIVIRPPSLPFGNNVNNPVELPERK